ncbi:MAG TPA: hypothetical protein PKU92_11445, partial [Agitococcus sp.]|nr:hypothetical protein [Agitococcus sp.]
YDVFIKKRKTMKPLFDTFRSHSLEILANLKERYGLLLRRDLVSAKLLHKEGQLFLEYTVTDKDNYSFDNKVITKSLTLTAEINDALSLQNSIFENARYIVEELPPTSLAQMADIFDESSAAAIINYAQKS